MVICRPRLPSHSRDHRTILTSRLRISTEVRGQRIWMPLFSPQTRLSSRTHRAAKWPQSITTHRPQHRRRERRECREEEAASQQERAGAVAYLYVVVRLEVQEVAVASQEALLGGDVGHVEMEEQKLHGAKDTPTSNGTSHCYRVYRVGYNQLILFRTSLPHPHLNLLLSLGLSPASQRTGVNAAIEPSLSRMRGYHCSGIVNQVA
jgi:hypothetical protein